MTAPLIEVTDLSKTYPDGTHAVKAISFHVNHGEFFGFLGPNGAGKSTTIKMLITLLAPTSGSAKILGHDVSTEPDAIRRKMGYAAQETGVDDDLTGRENLQIQGRLHHIPKQTLNQRISELLKLMDLTDDADRAAGAYSGGMRKRLDLATGLLHRPSVLFLDEPTTGLDPQNRAGLWKYLERLNKDEGLSIFLTTHYMEEADKLCNRLAIIDHGKIIASDSPANLKAQLGGDVISLSFKDPASSHLAISHLKSLPQVKDASPTDDGINVIVADGGATVPIILSSLAQAGLTISRLNLTSPTLDDVFLKFTGQSIRREELNANWRGRRSGWGPPARRRGP